jgi:hypothetical protein
MGFDDSSLTNYEGLILDLLIPLKGGSDTEMVSKGEHARTSGSGAGLGCHPEFS